MEVFISLVGLVGGVILLALFTASIVTIYAQLTESDNTAQRRLQLITEFMISENCPLDLRRRVRKHMEYVLIGSKSISVHDALNGVSHPLRAEIALFRCRELVQRVPFLSDAANPDPAFIKRVVMQLHREAFSPGDKVMEEGEVAMSMYFLATGLVQVYINKGTKLVTSLRDGSYIGEIALLQALHKETSSHFRALDDRRSATVQAVTFTTAFQLSKTDFKASLVDYPEMLEALQAVAMERMRLCKSAQADARHESAGTASATPDKHTRVIQRYSGSVMSSGNGQEGKRRRSLVGSRHEGARRRSLAAMTAAPVVRAVANLKAAAAETSRRRHSCPGNRDSISLEGHTVSYKGASVHQAPPALENVPSGDLSFKSGAAAAAATVAESEEQQGTFSRRSSLVQSQPPLELGEDADREDVGPPGPAPSVIRRAQDRTAM